MKKLFRLLVAAFGIKCAQSSGVISVLITKISNSAGKDITGKCCDASPNKFGICDLDECDTYFKVCVSTFSSDDGQCLFGSSRTPVLGGNSFEKTGIDQHFIMKIPFKKSWAMSYRLDMEAWDEDVGGSDQLIEKQTVQNWLQPSNQWKDIKHNGKNALFEYKIKVECDANYYGVNCAKNCEPRDDLYGHFTCDSDGQRICLDHWQGEYCDEPVCSETCHPEHGYCEVAGECRCRQGWTGKNCNECVVREGCQHGTCNEPFECNCDEFWGGNDCEINLNACGDSPNPCQNGAICENKYGNFTCTCPKGFSGTHCENADNACVQPNVCKNGGSCRPDGELGFECLCMDGFYGPRCENEIDECIEQPCSNGAECINKINDFECICPPGWMGKTCQIDVDECKYSNRCVNSKGCINQVGDFLCICQDGWTGKLCDQNINECDPDNAFSPCQNGGQCLDTLGGFKCKCPAGFRGDHCEIDINECQIDPCKNGGECVDQTNDYKCLCPAGFSGKNCQVPMGFCSISPCLNGGKCFNVEADYECSCPDEFEGKNCQNIKDKCKLPNNKCTVINACNTTISTMSKWGYKKEIETSKVCGANGECISDSLSDYRCSCHPGFTGEYCEINIDDCTSNPCENDGVCIDQNDGYTCSCPPGYSGRYCQIRDNFCLSSSPCKNGAKCTLRKFKDYTCSCRPGWFGKQCNQRETKDLCKSNPCKAGECIETNNGNGFTCKCPSHLTGSVCQYAKILPCDRNNKCGPFGKCENLKFNGQDDENSYKCHCNAGYEGVYCEDRIDHCQPNPCFNGSKCLSKQNHYECECRPGFDGPQCRHDIDECKTNPCAIGAKCIDQINTFKCECPPGRTGHLCEKLISAPNQRSCSYKGDLFVHSYEWSELCNRCKCLNGQIECTKLDCGYTQCSRYSSDSCELDEQCISLDTPTHSNCVSETCHERFFCVPKNRNAPYRSDQGLCDGTSNSQTRRDGIAKINLQFKVKEIMQFSEGVHSSDVCSALRYISVLKKYAKGQNVQINCCSNNIGTVIVTIEHEQADEMAKAIRQSVIEGPREAAHNKDRIIINSIYDIDIIHENEPASTIWIILAVLLSILLVLILILGAFIIRHKMSRSRSSNDASNYTLGSSSGCTDQLVMTSSPSATHDGMISDGTDSEHFIYISSRNKPHQIYHNRRLSHIIHRNELISPSPGPGGPPPSYDESSRLYSTVDNPSNILNQPTRINLNLQKSNHI